MFSRQVNLAGIHGSHEFSFSSFQILVSLFLGSSHTLGISL